MTYGWGKSADRARKALEWTGHLRGDQGYGRGVSEARRSRVYSPSWLDKVKVVLEMVDNGVGVSVPSYEFVDLGLNPSSGSRRAAYPAIHPPLRLGNK